LMFGIAEQWETELIFVIEFFLLLGGIRADANSRDTKVFQFGQCIPHRLRLAGSAGGVCFWVKIDKQFVAFEVGQFHCVTALVLSIKCRRLVTWFQFCHLSSPFGWILV